MSPRKRKTDDVQIEIVHPDGTVEVVSVEALREEEAKAWSELDPKLRDKALAYLRTLPPDLKALLRAKIAMGGDWPTFNEYEDHAIPSPFHFNTGMHIRNELRRNVCADNELPTGNWDDYYVRAIEESLA